MILFVQMMRKYVSWINPLESRNYTISTFPKTELARPECCLFKPVIFLGAWNKKKKKYIPLTYYPTPLCNSSGQKSQGSTIGFPFRSSGKQLMKNIKPKGRSAVWQTDLCMGELHHTRAINSSFFIKSLPEPGDVFVPSVSTHLSFHLSQFPAKC